MIPRHHLDEVQVVDRHAGALLVRDQCLQVPVVDLLFLVGQLLKREEGAAQLLLGQLVPKRFQT